MQNIQDGAGTKSLPDYNKSLRNNAQRKNIMKILKMIFPFHNIYAGKDNTVYFKYV